MRQNKSNKHFWWLFIFLILIIVTLSNCDMLLPSNTAEIIVQNNDPDGWSIDATVDNSTKTISASSSKTWEIEWKGTGSKTVMLEAKYTSHGGNISDTIVVNDGEAWTWKVNYITGYF